MSGSCVQAAFPRSIAAIYHYFGMHRHSKNGACSMQVKSFAIAASSLNTKP